MSLDRPFFDAAAAAAAATADAAIDMLRGPRAAPGRQYLIPGSLSIRVA